MKTVFYNLFKGGEEMKQNNHFGKLLVLSLFIISFLIGSSNSVKGTGND